MLESMSVRFLVSTETSPAILPRVLQPFARRDLTPERMWSERLGSGMQIEIAVPAIPPDIIYAVEGNLRQVVGVHRVRCIAASSDTAFSLPD